MNKKLIILLAVGAAILGAVIFFRYSGSSSAALWQLSNGGKWLFPLVIVSAILDSINPCAFSILLLTIAFLFSVGRNRAGIVKIGGVYIAGIFVVYILIGLGILQTLHIFNTPHFMAKIGAFLMIAFGVINLINEFFPSFPIKLKIPQVSHRWLAAMMERASMPAAFVLGVLVGICEFPCTGGPYLMILGLLHDQATFWSGFSYLLFYNLIFVLPLVVMLLIASHERLLQKAEQWKKEETGKMRFVMGLVMILLGIVVFLI